MCTHRLLAALAVPDARRLTLDCDLAAERAGVFAVLADFDLLDLLAERSTVASTVLACYSLSETRWRDCNTSQKRISSTVVRRSGRRRQGRTRTGCTDR